MMEHKKARLPWSRRAKVFLAAGLGIVLAGLFLWIFFAQAPEYELTTFSMGSYVRQTVWGTRGEAAAQEAAQAVQKLEQEISWRQEGEIAQVNQKTGEERVPLGTNTGELLEEILELCEKSGGALDVTLGPVTRLWDFDNDPHLPGEKELEDALTLVDYTQLSVDKEEYLEAVNNADGGHTDSLGVKYYASLKKLGMAVDLGAVGKGAACDAALEVYRKAGIRGAVAAVGGSIGLYGRKPDGSPWRVSVRDPEGAGSIGVLELEEGFVSTSGSYEKFFEQDGRVYCHLLDPRTGYPAETELVSVTVWCRDSGAMSDGLATACFVLGRKDGTALLKEYGAEAVFMDRDGQITVTDGLADRFTLNNGGSAHGA